MEKEHATLSSSGLYGGEGGAGGKLRKPPSRRPPKTPYDRPPATKSGAAANGRDGGWLSKLVDPACRLIAGGATRIFPSFFSKSQFAAAESDTEYHAENSSTEARENAEDDDDDDEGCTSNLGILESTGGIDSSEGADAVNNSSDFDQPGQEKLSTLANGSELSIIEQLVKGRTFSRDEINRLTEILKSRVADISNVETGVRKPNMAVKIDGERTLVAHEILGMSADVKQDDLNRPTLGTLMLDSAVKEVGVSPVDIARAYMGSRVSEVGNDLKKIISTDDRILLQSCKVAPEPLISSPSPKSSMCWPGAMLHDQHGYPTPQSSRYGLHYLQRTPYSRTLYSKSKSKLIHSQAEKKSYVNMVPTPGLQPQSPFYGQSKDDAINDGHGSVGPIRRLRRKFLSEARPSRGSMTSLISQNGPSQAANSKGFLTAVKKNLGAGVTSHSSQPELVDNSMNSSEVGISALQTSNPAARAILEHLERNKPTPKEKSAELQLATAWKKSSPAKATGTMLKEGTSLMNLEGFSSHKNKDSFDKGCSSQGNDRGKTTIEGKPQEKDPGEATDMNKDIEASIVNGSHSCQTKWTNQTAPLESLDSRKKGLTQLWALQDQTTGQTVANAVPNHAGSEPLKRPAFQPSASKPTLAAISVDRPGLRQTNFSDNTSGFTFPFSTSSSELPTPSIVPTTLAGGLSQPKDSLAIPSYSFGTKRSTPVLVFSFPSTSNASTPDGTEDIKFSFGSDKKNRISFSSVGKDAICY
ncbi:hypothetical protein NMG60_11013257 [Bertholletia excelsa]